jgi:hypothetical protein
MSSTSRNGRLSAISGHWRGLSDGHSNVGYDLQSAHRPIGRADAMFEGDCALTAWLAFRKKEIHYERGAQRVDLPESKTALHLTVPVFLTFACREYTIRVHEGFAVRSRIH